jgi:hypothetical protein
LTYHLFTEEETEAGRPGDPPAGCAFISQRWARGGPALREGGGALGGWRWGLRWGGAWEAGLPPRHAVGPGRERGSLSSLHARAPARPRPCALPLLRQQRRAAQAAVYQARGPGVQRGLPRGPAPRPGRMRSGAAQELSRVPAPASPGPGLRSRCCHPAPERNDFQAAFRLDSLQVRRRWPSIFSSVWGCRQAHYPSTPRAWGGSRAPGHPELGTRGRWGRT